MLVNHVMEPAVCPEGFKPLNTKWVYRTKLDKNGNIKSYKARLVVKGYEQIHGIDYDETYSSVADTPTLIHTNYIKRLALNMIPFLDVGPAHFDHINNTRLLVPYYISPTHNTTASS